MASLPERRAPVTECHGPNITRSAKIKRAFWKLHRKPYQVSPKGWYQLRFSDSDIQLYRCKFYPMHPVTDSQYSSIIFAALNLERSLPWYWYSILNLGGLRFLHSRLNWTAWRRAWSGSSNNAESHRSATGRSMSFHHLPCAVATHGNKAGDLRSPNAPGGDLPSKPVEAGLCTAHLGWQKMLTIGPIGRLCDWEGRHRDSAHSTHGNQCGFVAWTFTRVLSVAW